MRIATSLWVLAGGWLLAQLARASFGERAALLTLAAYCAMSFDQAGVFHASSTEAFLLPWFAAGLYCWQRARARDEIGWAVAAGVCAAFAYQTKQTGIALSLALGADALLRAAEPSARRALAAMAGGLALATACVFAALASAGALGAYLDATWTHNWSYVGRRDSGLALAGRALRDVARWDLGLWLLGIAGWIHGWRHSPPASGSRAIALLGGASFAAALFAGQSYAHYYTLVIVPVALGCGWLGHRAWEAQRAAGNGAARAAWTLLLVAPWLAPAWNLTTSVANPGTRVAAMLAPVPALTGSLEAAEVLAERSDEGEAVLVLGSEPQIYFYARRPAATRFPILYPLSGPYPHSPSMQEELLRTLRDTPPRHVIFATDWRSHAEDRTRATQWLQRIRPLLDKSYRPEIEFPGDLLLLRRVER